MAVLVPGAGTGEVVPTQNIGVNLQRGTISRQGTPGVGPTPSALTSGPNGTMSVQGTGGVLSTTISVTGGPSGVMPVHGTCGAAPVPSFCTVGPSGTMSMQGTVGVAPTPSAFAVGPSGTTSLQGTCGAAPVPSFCTIGPSEAMSVQGTVGAASVPSFCMGGPSGTMSVQGICGVAPTPSVVAGGLSGATSVPGVPKFDSEWIRLAIVVHEFSCDAAKWVLDDIICQKFPNLVHKTFDERLEDALRLDKTQLTKDLISYQIRIVFPKNGYGKYADFDIGIIKNMIRSFVGKFQWAQAIAGLPNVENLQGYNWAMASPLALVELLSGFRNWTFHHTGSVSNFSQLWDDFLKILHGLNYDTSKVSYFKSGPLDDGSKVADEAVMRLLIEDDFVRAQEACWCVHEGLLKSRELDIYGDQIDGKSKSDMMVSLVTVRCKDADSARLREGDEIEYHLKRSFSELKAFDVHEILNQDRVVLVRGLPGSGKSTLCHFILREWQAGQLWKDRNYDFVFYVNAPFVFNLLHTGPVSEDSVLKALYPNVFSEISYEQLLRLNYLIIIDSIDECDVEKICSPVPSMTAEFAIKQLIVSPKKYDRIVVGRPHACDEVREKLLKEVPFNFIEVVGFSSEQLELYVTKFCGPDGDKAAVVWKKLQDNQSLFGMAHLPVFANIACNILSEYNSVPIKTQTELYVWAYVVFLTRHLRKRHADVDVSTFKIVFQHDQLIDALAKVSEMAYNHLTTGKIFFEVSDFKFSEIESTLVSSFLVRRQKFLCFCHLTLMEFLAAVYLFSNPVKFGKKILGNQHLRGVFHIYYGLLGASATNSDSPETIRDFVEPLTKKFKLRPLINHPIKGRIGRCIFDKGEFHDVYLNLCFEFQNARLLQKSNFFWMEGAVFIVQHHHQIDALVFFCKHFCFGKRRVQGLQITPADSHLSVVEYEKLRDCLVVRGSNVSWLVLSISRVSEDEMEALAFCCTSVSTITINFVEAPSSRHWSMFLRSWQSAKQTGTLRIKKLRIFGGNVDRAISIDLKKLGVEIFGA